MSEIELKLEPWDWGRVYEVYSLEKNGRELLKSIKVLFPTDDKSSKGEGTVYGWREEGKVSGKGVRKVIIEIPSGNGVEVIMFFDRLIREYRKDWREFPLNLKSFIDIRPVNLGISGKSWTVPAVVAILATILNVQDKLFFVSGEIKGGCKLGNISCEGKFVNKKLNVVERMAELTERNLISFIVNCKNYDMSELQGRKAYFPSMKRNSLQLQEISDCDNFIKKMSTTLFSVAEDKLIEKLRFFFNPFRRWKEKSSVKLNSVVPGVEGSLEFVELELEALEREIVKDEQGEIKEEKIKSRTENARGFLKYVIKCVDREDIGWEIPVCGAGGSGKTFLLRWLYNQLLEVSNNVLPIYLEAKNIISSIRDAKLDEIRNYFAEVPPFLVIIDGLDETSERFEFLKEYVEKRLRELIGNDTVVKGWIYSSREVILKGKGHDEIIGFKTKAIEKGQIESFIRSYVKVITGKDEKVEEVYKQFESFCNRISEFSDLLSTPFYLAIFTYLAVENRLEDAEDHHQLVVSFIKSLLEGRNLRRIEDADIRKELYFISMLAIWGLMAFLMLRAKLYEDKGTYFQAIDSRNVDLSLDFSDSKKNIREVEISYGDSLVSFWGFKKDKGAAFSTMSDLCDKRKIEEFNPYSLSLLLFCDLLGGNLKKSPDLQHGLESLLLNVLSIEALKRSGILTVEKRNQKEDRPEISLLSLAEPDEYAFSFTHRIIHENLISAFIAIVSAFLKDTKEFKFNGKKSYWKNAVKLIGMLEDTGIPGHITPFEYLSVSVLWMKEIAGWLGDKSKVYDFALNLLNILEEVKAENDDFFNALRDSVIFNYLDLEEA